jgi:hypothetical protein
MLDLYLYAQRWTLDPTLDIMGRIYVDLMTGTYTAAGVSYFHIY